MNPPAHDAPPALRWPALLAMASGVGLLTAIATAVAGGFAANAACEWYRVSSFEGGAGYFVVGFGLLAALAGFAIGAGTVAILRRAGAAGFFGMVARSLAIALALTASIAGLAYAVADRPPTFDGQLLRVEFELRCPLGFVVPGGDDARFQVSLSSGRQHHQTATLRPDAARQEDGVWIVPGTVDLESSRPDRQLGVYLELPPSRFIALPIPARPGAAHSAWTDWLPTTLRGDLSPLQAGREFSARVRVVPRGEALDELRGRQ